MFKATLDGNGLVIYSDQPEGELLSNMAENDGSEIKSSSLLSLEPSVVLKGAFAVKNNWDRMSSFDRPYQMSDFAPFDMIRFGLLGSQIYTYLLERHPNLMLIGVEVEYKELVGSSLPVGLTMWIDKGGEWSSGLNPFFFKEHTGGTGWQVAHLSLENAFLDGDDDVCPFKTLQDAPRNEEGFVWAENAYELFGCFKHVELWTYGEENYCFSPPVFILSGGISAVRRIHFQFASSQFWGGFKNAAELIQLYERPAPPDPVDPVDPVDPGDPGDPDDPSQEFDWINPVVDGELIVKIEKSGNTTGQVNLSRIEGAASILVYGSDAWCPFEDVAYYACFDNIPNLVGAGTFPTYYYIGEPSTDSEEIGGEFSLNSDGSWFFDTNGDFEHLGTNDAIGLVIYIIIMNEIEELLCYTLNIQVGDMTQDYFGGGVGP